MFTSETVSYAWRLWVDMFAGLHLPWGPQTTALIGLAAVFYLIGAILKALVSPEK